MGRWPLWGGGRRGELAVSRGTSTRIIPTCEVNSTIDPISTLLRNQISSMDLKTGRLPLKHSHIVLIKTY